MWANFSVNFKLIQISAKTAHLKVSILMHSQCDSSWHGTMKKKAILLSLLINHHQLTLIQCFFFPQSREHNVVNFKYFFFHSYRSDCNLIINLHNDNAARMRHKWTSNKRVCTGCCVCKYLPSNPFHHLPYISWNAHKRVNTNQIVNFQF